MLKVGLFFIAILVSVNAVAKVITPIWQLGFEGGGEALRVSEDPRDFKLQAGHGFFVSVGVMFAITDTTPHRFEGQLSLAYKTINGKEEDLGSVKWSHIPIELMYFYRNMRNGFRLGYGLSYFMDSELEGQDSRSTIHRKYEDSFGYILAIEKSIVNKNQNSLVSYGVRYNFRDFKPENGGIGKSGDGPGVYITVGLP